MTQQTSRMTTLVEDLLTLAKLEGSPRPTCDRWTPVARLFAQVESEARGLSAGRHTVALQRCWATTSSPATRANGPAPWPIS